MAITIRYPDGQAITYNDAAFLTRSEISGWVLSTKDPSEPGSRYIAFVQPNAGATVEFVRPCSVSNPITREAPEQAVATVKQHLRTLPTQLVKELKLALRPFNAKRHTWKG